MHAEVVHTVSKVGHVGWQVLLQHGLVPHVHGSFNVLLQGHDLGCNLLEALLQCQTRLLRQVLSQLHTIDAIIIWAPLNAAAHTKHKLLRGVHLFELGTSSNTQEFNDDVSWLHCLVDMMYVCALDRLSKLTAVSVAICNQACQQACAPQQTVAH